MPRPDSLPIRILLTALVAFGPLSTDLYLPSLPTLVRVFDTDVVTVQMTLSIFLIGFAVSQLIYGPMSDRFGRRPTLLVGVTIYLAASAVCAMTTSIEGLIAARFFQALGACCGRWWQGRWCATSSAATGRRRCWPTCRWRWRWPRRSGRCWAAC